MFERENEKNKDKDKNGGNTHRKELESET